MRVLLISKSDAGGGADLAAYRLAKALDEVGIEAKLLVRFREGEDEQVDLIPASAFGLLRRGRGWVDKLPGLFLREPETLFSLNLLSARMREVVAGYQPDLVHFHWVHGGFLGIEAMAHLGCPVVWTLHDMWAFTGGCHYAQGCRRFEQECTQCPLIRSGPAAWNDPARWVFRRKERAWRGWQAGVITPSRWMAGEVAASRLLGRWPLRAIDNALPIETFHPGCREEGRHRLGLAQGERALLLVNPHQKRKGADLIGP